jgi:hypothetical protein
LLYKKLMALGAQLPIRLDPEVQEKFEAVARQIGTSKSALLRLLAKSFVEQVVDAEGVVHLPPDWKELLGRLPAADGRARPVTKPSRAQRRQAGPAALPVDTRSKADIDATALLAQHVPSQPGRGRG